MSRIFKMSIGANLKLLKKINEKLQKVIDQESNNQWISVGMDDDIENGRYALAKELQENIKKWKSDIGYAEGVKEIDKLLR